MQTAGEEEEVQRQCTQVGIDGFPGDETLPYLAAEIGGAILVSVIGGRPQRLQVRSSATCGPTPTHTL